MEKVKPDYKRIYNDILRKKYPQKKEMCKALLSKENLSVQDILELNKKIFETEEKKVFEDNQRLRSYRKSDILQILEYQKKNNLNNSQLANHFKMSRNTIAKWKKQYQSSKLMIDELFG